MDWTPEEAAGYAAAMIDGEGTVYYRIRDGRLKGQRVAVAVADKELCDAYLEALAVLGITAWYYLRDFQSWRAKGKPPLHEGGISHRLDFEALLARVPIRSIRKRQKLRELIAAYAQPRPQRRRGVVAA